MFNNKLIRLLLQLLTLLRLQLLVQPNNKILNNNKTLNLILILKIIKRFRQINLSKNKIMDNYSHKLQ